MLATEGFAGHVWSNQLKSVLLLMGFPVLLLLMMAAFFGALGAFSGGQPGSVDTARAWNAAVSGVAQYGHWAVLAAGAWFVIAYFFHGSMMRAATGSVPITRAEMPKNLQYAGKTSASRAASQCRNSRSSTVPRSTPLRPALTTRVIKSSSRAALSSVCRTTSWRP